MLFKIEQIILFFLLLLFFINSIYSEKELIIDEILAIVGNEAITLSDLKIIIYFNLYPDIEKREIKKYIERMINQKIIKKKIKMNFSLEKEINNEMERLIKWFGSEKKLSQELLKFDLNWSDLKAYLEEKIYFDKVIMDRFKFISPITLDEIKKYYNEIYVPEQRKKKLYPKSLLEVASEIESIITKQKRKKLISDWLKDLKKGEDIEIKVKDFGKLLTQIKYK
ncbi:hypothetical protein NLC29_00595 [Candidatus Aminicenantes bacterium AH-873-B07]|nr:hypothetical protein [Candidatus Aminicenantes bacterium AH-873-B07]